MSSGEEFDAYYEYIVVGCGGVGSGTLFWLAKRVGNSEYENKHAFPHLVKVAQL